MKSNLKRTLFTSVAALGFFAAVGAFNGQNASAKTYAKVTSNQPLAMNAADRNVNFTGTKALYSKAGTLKGARLVAGTSTLSNLATSNSSQDNVRAYRVARTNRGSIYYKVVTFDGQYRGWIYGGTSNSDFGGGLVQYATAKSAGLTTDQQTGTFKIANPGTANDGKTVTYKQPAWTQYKIGRQITDSSAYANTTFKIDQAATRTREGDTWVHISATDSSKSAANGWILYSGLTKLASTTPTTPTTNKSVQIILTDPNGNQLRTISYTNANAVQGNTLGSVNGNTWSLAPNDASSITTQINQALAGTGYGLSGNVANGALTSDQISALAQAKFGSSVTIKTVALGQGTLAINPQDVNGVNLALGNGPTISESANPSYADINGAGKLGNYNAVTLYKIQNSSDSNYKSQYQSLMSAMNPGWFKTTKNDINTINNTYLNEAKKEYLSKSLPVLHGINGEKVSGSTITGQVAGLKSPLYPQFVKEGGFLWGIVGGQYVLRWYQISYTPASADDATYCSGSVNVRFNANVPSSSNYVQ